MPVTSRLAAVVMLAVAGGCGPKQTRPRYDTAKLAHQLHVDLTELGEIARRHRGDCSALVTALDPHVSGMRAHADEVKRVQQDPELAQQLRKDVAAYDDRHRGLADAIGADLGASYQACRDNTRLLEIIDRIPEL